MCALVSTRLFHVKGQKYAILELKVVLSHLLRKFEFSIQEGQRINASSEIVLKPVDGIHLIVTSR